MPDEKKSGANAAAESAAQQESGANSPAESPDAQATLSDLAAIKAKVSEYENDVKRIQAEFENYRKRTDKEKTDWLIRGKLDGMREFLVLADELDEAAKHAKNSSPEQLSKGISLLHSKIHSILKSNKIEEISCAGHADASLHDVLLQTEGGEEGKISAVIRKGYKCGGHILRHAQVAVYSGAKKEEAKKADEKNAEGKTKEEHKLDGKTKEEAKNQ